jgi:hypothetical protein
MREKLGYIFWYSSQNLAKLKLLILIKKIRIVTIKSYFSRVMTDKCKGVSVMVMSEGNRMKEERGEPSCICESVNFFTTALAVTIIFLQS